MWHVWRRKQVYTGFCLETQGTRPLGRPRRRWEDNIKMNLQEVGWGAWTGLIWLRIGTGDGSFKCSNEPSGSIKCWDFFFTSWEPGNFSRWTLLHGVLLWFVSPTGRRLIHCRVYEITLRHTTSSRTPPDLWSARRKEHNTTNKQTETDIHVPGWIRTLTPSKRAAADPTLELAATGIGFRWIPLFMQLDK
jgi:hypothetical protein